ncbi:hypothetical protein A3850_011955 [Lewinella sp. 4G2]|nr:hypothetical protein A3850_011955 [Lewinella sp. 4G2]
MKLIYYDYLFGYFVDLGVDLNTRCVTAKFVESSDIEDGIDSTVVIETLLTIDKAIRSGQTIYGEVVLDFLEYRRSAYRFGKPNPEPRSFKIRFEAIHSDNCQELGVR